MELPTRLLGCTIVWARGNLAASQASCSPVNGAGGLLVAVRGAPACTRGVAGVVIPVAVGTVDATTRANTVLVGAVVVVVVVVVVEVVVPVECVAI